MPIVEDFEIILLKLKNKNGVKNHSIYLLRVYPTPPNPKNKNKHKTDMGHRNCRS